MKYKYKLINNDEDKQLIIQEYIEIESENFFLVCEETYNLENLKDMLSIGESTLKKTIRTHNIYPSSNCMISIVSALTKMLTNGNCSKKTIEINFDDKTIDYKNNNDENRDNDNNHHTIGESNSYTNIDELLEDDFTKENKKNNKVVLD